MRWLDPHPFLPKQNGWGIPVGRDTSTEYRRGGSAFTGRIRSGVHAQDSNSRRESEAPVGLAGMFRSKLVAGGKGGGTVQNRGFILKGALCA